MKKKILSLTLVVCLLAIAVVGGTLAYFTDTDNETNTFTVGNVKIDLVEEFDETKAVLRPGTKDTNAIDKKVWIKNEGTETAYLWYEWLIPAVLDTTDGRLGTDNIVHVNSLGATWDKWFDNAKYADYEDEKYTGVINADNSWDHDPEVELGYTQNGPEGFIGTETIDGVVYNKYLVLYKAPVEAGKFTPQAMDQVYLDSRVDFDGTNYTFMGKVINYDFSKNIDIIVRAYGIQEAGFDDVYEAYEAFQVQYKA